MLVFVTMFVEEIMDQGPLSSAIFFFSVDFARYLLIAGTGFLLFYKLKPNFLKNRFTFRKKPKLQQMKSEFLHSIKTVAVYGIITGAVQFSRQTFDLPKLYFDQSEYGDVYLVFSIVVLIVLQDTYFYWTHRFMHLPQFYKTFHKVHHQSVDPTPWTAYSFNWPEAFVHALYVFLMVHLIPLHPNAIASFMLFMISINVIGHCGYEIFPRYWLDNPIFNLKTTVTHHALHHHRPKWNFGLYFTWWDRWMKTEDPNYRIEFEKRFREKVPEKVPGPVYGR